MHHKDRDMVEAAELLGDRDVGWVIHALEVLAGHRSVAR